MTMFFNFLIPFLVAFAGGILTFLIGTDAGGACAGGSIFAGCWSGIATAIAFEFGADSGWKLKNVLPKLIGGVVGGVLGGIMLTIG